MIQLGLAITELEKGGAEQCLVRLALKADRRRFAPRVYSLGPRPPRGRDELPRQLEAAGTPVHFLNARSKWDLPKVVLRLRKMLREHRVDVLQSFLFHANIVSALATFGRRGPRLFWGVRVADPNGGRLRLERWLARRTASIIYVSQAAADFYLRRGFPLDRCVVIPNSVDGEQFSPHAAAWSADELAELNLSPQRLRMAYVGRLHPQKGLDRLLRAAPEIFARLPAWDWVLAGDGPQRQELQQLAEELGIASRVHFLGWRSDIPRVLASSSLLVLPSRWEGMPNAVLEAMAAGLPVMCAPAEGVQELLGPLAPRQTVEKNWEKRIVELGEDVELRRELGEANRRRVAEVFSPAAMVRAYERVYRR